MAIVDRLMAAPTDSLEAQYDIYRQRARQAPAERVVFWWSRLKWLGTSAFGDPCTWTKDQQEVTFDCFINGSRYPRDLARVANKALFFSEDHGVRFDHLEDLTRACGESRPTQELTHHLTFHPSDPAYSPLGTRRIPSNSKTSTKSNSQALTASAGVGQPRRSHWKQPNRYRVEKDDEDQANVLCNKCNRKPCRQFT